MPTQFQQDDNELEINEYEVFEGPDTVVPENVETRTRMDEELEASEVPKKKNEYGWAFFLCSLFVGVGLFLASSSLLPLFLGLGFGFLFFVDPIYQRVIDLFE